MDTKIDQKHIQHRNMQKSKIIEMQKMPNSLKSDAPDLERTPKVAKVIWKRDNKSSQN